MKIKELFESLLVENIRVDTSAYKRSHGKEPRGSGRWIIKVNGKEYMIPSTNYSHAIDLAIKQAHEEGNKKEVDVVEPQP